MYCDAACRLHKMAFFSNDRERFLKYMTDVASGKRKISGATLFPYQLLIEAQKVGAETAKTYAALPAESRMEITHAMTSVIDAQWNSMVHSLRDAASAPLDNCIAVVDVSGSMSSAYRKFGGVDSSNMNDPQPLDVALSLGILIAQLSRPPFSGAFIAFSADPKICRLKTNASLSEMALAMKREKWGLNTSVYKVFKLLLQVAFENKLKRSDMVKKVFILSDMDFDQADKDYLPNGQTSSYLETPHQTVKRKFAAAGYDMPELVYWNIRGKAAGAGTLPVQADEPGVEFMSGFSASLMKVFLGQAEREKEVASKEAREKDEFDDLDMPVDKKTKAVTTPADKLRMVLQNPAFAKLKTVD